MLYFNLDCSRIYTRGFWTKDQVLNPTSGQITQFRCFVLKKYQEEHDYPAAQLTLLKIKRRTNCNSKFKIFKSILIDVAAAIFQESLGSVDLQNSVSSNDCILLKQNFVPNNISQEIGH